ncbi:MAG: transcriptional regulator [Aequorivita sp.]|jgi:DNA-binding HxlR family transcriptional regulator|uniref:winged helix-turn-helix transcriptional regulator n=1 Tax=Lewinella cohaerens TaxID=70995 RepID=UPI0003750E3F|nr:helix-turn-helix domain-containing protein [Lewinella cohaerens]MAB39968.1 transcriptional regulator [Aequorivita sp.]MBP42657.1 transcriptional regulator [Aequorivita sp.]|tara:strand:- start:3187 stop:3576 length:390 start_codon:yes stop_codon:yes gene_type:complete
MSRISQLESVKKCSGEFVLAINDTMNVLNGKWKLPIIGSLLYGKKRFKELEREIPKITPRMLSKELKDLEVNGIVTRTVYDTIPVTVEYELTESGNTLNMVLDAMIAWGLQHRKIVIGKKKKVAEIVSV